MAGQGSVIKDIFAFKVDANIYQFMVFTVTWYILFSSTYGTNVPSGIFLPGMIIGCALGQVVAMICLNFDVFSNDEYDYNRSAFILLGCAAMLAGYTRMTYSLAVILMETSHSNEMFVPILFTIIISNQVGYKFTHALYHRSYRAKQFPIILDEPPKECRKIIA